MNTCWRNGNKAIATRVKEHHADKLKTKRSNKNNQLPTGGPTTRLTERYWHNDDTMTNDVLQATGKKAQNITRTMWTLMKQQHSNINHNTTTALPRSTTSMATQQLLQDQNRYNKGFTQCTSSISKLPGFTSPHNKATRKAKPWRPLASSYTETA